MVKIDTTKKGVQPQQMRFSIPEKKVVAPTTKDCHECALRETATQVVWGSGSNKRVVIIGEAAGQTEDNMGKPFVGESGKLLRKVIGENDFYITNAVKCRPPANRTPTKVEITKCSSLYIEEELKEAVIVVLLGKTAQTLKMLYPSAFKDKMIIDRPHPAHSIYKHYQNDWIVHFKNELRYFVLMLFDEDTAYAINEKL